MKTTGSWFRRFVRFGCLTGVAVVSTQWGAQADDSLLGMRTPKDAAARSSSTRAPLMSMRVIDSMIDDARRDGALDTSEREMILNQAKRLLSPVQVADVEARLNQLPKAAVTPSAQLGTPVELGANPPVPAPIAMTSLEELAESHSPRGSTHMEGDCGSTEQCCSDSCSTRLLDNMYLFAAADAWRNPLDGNQSNNFGFRVGFNAGMPLLEDRGIGAQLGMSYGMYDFKGRFDLAPETDTTGLEQQFFLTTGLFKHCNFSNPCCPDRISWGIVYDRMITDNTGAGSADLNLGQIRGQIGYALNECDEIGLWGSVTDGSSDSFNVFDVEHTTRSIDQLNLFWHHKWCTCADTRAFVGIAEEPGSLVFGADGQVPLNNYWSLFGGFEYIAPSTSEGDPGFRDEIWNLTAGIAFHPGGNAMTRTVCGNRWTPLLPVADNGSFALDLGF